MKEFDFSEGREQFKLNFEGTGYTCTVPSQSYMVSWGRKATDKKNEGKVNELNEELFFEMGIPKEVTRRMSSTQVKQISDFIAPKKS